MTDDTVLSGLVTRLRREPECLQGVEDKLPKQGGFYVWWARRGALKHVPSRPHPSASGFDLLYVGIAPVSAKSAATIRSRVVGNHLRGNIAASTFRLTLAALLVDELRLEPVKRGNKVVLTPEENLQLSEWQQQHLRLTWEAIAQPRSLEKAVIEALKPPLNVADNGAEPFLATVSAARAALRKKAK